MAKPILPPMDLVTPDTPLRLAAAAAIAFPDQSVSAAVLRGEAERGRLQVERIGRRYYTTLRNIEAMREKCRVEPRTPVSISTNQRSDGLSERERILASQLAFFQTLNDFKVNSRRRQIDGRGAKIKTEK